jgi:hypothetical protein
VRTQDQLPGRSPIVKSLKAKHALNLEFFSDELPKKKVYLVDMSILLMAGV